VVEVELNQEDACETLCSGDAAHVPNFSGISLRCAVLEESHPPTTRMKSTVLLSTMSVTASCLSFRVQGGAGV
jgi:hypothetical protein